MNELVEGYRLLVAIVRGDLKAHKLGDGTAAYLIYQDDLDAYLASRSEASA